MVPRNPEIDFINVIFFVFGGSKVIKIAIKQGFS
jgi:hypothetical protein